MKKMFALFLGVVGLAAAAQAQDFTVEYRWMAVSTPPVGGGLGDQITANTVVSGMVLQVNSAYRQRFELQARAMRNDPGSNGGIVAVQGDVDVTNAPNGADTLLHNHNGSGAFVSGLGPRGPLGVFSDESFGVVDGVALPEGDPNLEVDGLHGLLAGTLGQTRTWEVGQPFPADPGFGIETWIPVYRVLIDVNASELDGTRATVTFNPFRSFAVNDWLPTQEYGVPEEESITVDFLPETVWATTQIPTSFQIQLAPAPASAALLCMGGLAVARRRRI